MVRSTHPQGELCRLRRDDERHERHERSVGAEKDRTQRSDDVPRWQWNLGKFGILMDFAIKILSLFPTKIFKKMFSLWRHRIFKGDE